MFRLPFILLMLSFRFHQVIELELHVVYTTFMINGALLAKHVFFVWFYVNLKLYVIDMYCQFCISISQ